MSTISQNIISDKRVELFMKLYDNYYMKYIDYFSMLDIKGQDFIDFVAIFKEDFSKIQHNKIFREYIAFKTPNWKQDQKQLYTQLAILFIDFGMTVMQDGLTQKNDDQQSMLVSQPLDLDDTLTIGSITSTVPNENMKDITRIPDSDDDIFSYPAGK